jgi:hypothetical protein
MENRNVTLSLPKALLRKAKLMALTRETSLSGLMAQLLAEAVANDDEYAQASRLHRAWLERDIDLGTHGDIGWTRDELHER